MRPILLVNCINDKVLERTKSDLLKVGVMVLKLIYRVINLIERLYSENEVLTDIINIYYLH